MIFDLIYKDLTYLIEMIALFENDDKYFNQYHEILNKYGVTDIEFEKYMLQKIDSNWVNLN